MASIISAGTTSGTSLNLSGDTSGVLQLASNGSTTAVTIDTSQNVGIGTASPAAPADVVSNSNAIAVSMRGRVSDDACVIRWTSNNGSTVNGRIQVNSGGDMIFQNTNSITERMRIDSSGNLIMASSAGYLGLPTNQTMRIPSTGGISYVGNINSATVFQIAYNSTSAGVQLSSGATSWGTFSDSRLKNITGTYTNALNDIAQIQPVKFTWKADEDSKPQVGVIAQSIQNVVPEAVDSTTIEMDGTEEYLTVRYTELIPLMIASIQELNEKVEAQAVRIAELEGAK
jgi:hypothetical protein